MEILKKRKYDSQIKLVNVQQYLPLIWAIDTYVLDII